MLQQHKKSLTQLELRLEMNRSAPVDETILVRGASESFL